MNTPKKSPITEAITYEGLSGLVSAAELRAFRQEVVTKWGKAGRIAVLLLGFGLGGGIGAMLMLVGITSSEPNMTVWGVVCFVGGISFSLLIIWLQRRHDRQSVRLRRFATDNGWRYSETAKNQVHQGIIFTQGHSRKSTRIIRGGTEPDTAGFELGTYQYTVGSGKSQRTYRWLYGCIELDRNVPHMVLDATANNAKLFGRSIASSLPASFSKEQVLKLEGDFNEHFTLYAPLKYKRDAYYIFTPDLMALLIDHSHSFDAEVIDNRMYLYARLPAKGMSLVDPIFMRKMLMIIHTIGMSMYRRTDYYSDENVGDRSADRVGDQGRRLRRGVGWVSLLVVGVYIMMQIISFILELPI